MAYSVVIAEIITRTNNTIRMIIIKKKKEREGERERETLPTWTY